MNLVVGIPTRNRAELAVAAIRSVLDAEVPDVRVVVSDNSTDPEQRRRLAGFCEDADGVEYLRPPKPVPMAPHWEWLWRSIDERLVPTHVTFLTDRLVFARGALEQIAAIAARHPAHVLSYRWDHVEDMEEPVELVQRPWTGALLELDARRLLELSSRGSIGDYLPRLMNCVAPREVMRGLTERFGNVFGDVSPDYRFAYRCLATLDSILYLDRPCLIEHGKRRSIGINYIRGRPNEDTARFEREAPARRFVATPEPAFETAANAIFQEYCAVRAEVGDRIPALTRAGYLAANAVAASRMRDPERRARQRALLARHGWTRRRRALHGAAAAARMAAYLVLHPTALVRTVRRQLVERPPGSASAALLRQLGIAAPVSDALRFDSSAAALAHAAAHPRPRQRHAWHVHELRAAGAILRRSDG